MKKIKSWKYWLLFVHPLQKKTVFNILILFYFKFLKIKYLISSKEKQAIGDDWVYNIYLVCEFCQYMHLCGFAISKLIYHLEKHYWNISAYYKIMI